MKTLIKRIFSSLFVLAIAILIFISLQTKPLKVETTQAIYGPMQITITAEGKTRVEDKFLVTAPITGKLSRIKLHRGDQVLLNDVITKIEPPPIIPLDIRQLAEAKARLSAAEGLKKEADTVVKRLEANYAQAQREYKRAQTLVESGLVSRQDFERVYNNEQASYQQLEEAKYRAYTANSEVEVAKATLLTVEQANPNNKTTDITIKSPIKGQVLHVIEENERVVTAGTPLLELSNQRMEVVIEVLSTDAVKIKTGADVIIEGWGGKSSLKAKVRLIEPSGFTKVSALGIEEQRVNVIADFLEPPKLLGDAYRVEAKIVIWEKENILKLPLSALFRQGQDWYVFIVENEVVKLRMVKIDHFTSSEAEILEGIKQGELIVIHPSNQLTQGIKVNIVENPQTELF